MNYRYKYKCRSCGGLTYVDMRLDKPVAETEGDILFDIEAGVPSVPPVWHTCGSINYADGTYQLERALCDFIGFSYRVDPSKEIPNDTETSKT